MIGSIMIYVSTSPWLPLPQTGEELSFSIERGQGRKKGKQVIRPSG